jgi:dGTPase
LPAVVVERCGTTRSSQLGAFVRAMVQATAETGRIGMTRQGAEALAAFRTFNYDNVYLRPASRDQATAVVALLQALVEHYSDHPDLMPEAHDLDAGSSEAVSVAVGYVAGMTDRYACRQAMALLGWDHSRLPQGIDV